MRLNLFALLIICAGCKTKPETPMHRPTADDLIRYQQQWIAHEEKDMVQYAQKHGLQLRKTGTGVRYQHRVDTEALPPGPGDQVALNYRVELLDGTPCYHSEPGHAEVFTVEMDDVESGLHEAVQLFGQGDSAVVLIPSHRAHGLIGDMEKVPMRSTVVYHLGVAKVIRAQKP
jgi:FKBP-type peptidyl-prolyl cis-trans isomerase FkpA